MPNSSRSPLLTARVSPALLTAALTTLLSISDLGAQAVAPDAQPVTPAPAAAVGSAPADVAVLRKEAQAALQAGDWKAYRQRLLALHVLRPWNMDYMTQIVLASAQLNDRRAAYDMMLRMQQQGLSHDFNQEPQAEPLRGTQAYDHINDLLKAQGEPAGDAVQAFSLPPDLLLPTAIAWDAGREAFLVANAREGAIHAVSPEGQATLLLRATPENGLLGIFGLAIDAERGRLWVSAGGTPVFAGNLPEHAGRSALFQFDLATLELKSRHAAPPDAPHLLAALAVGPAGEVYVADSLQPRLFSLPEGGADLQPFVAAPGLTSLRGMALSADGKLLYLADHELGIVRVDIAQQQASPLEGAQKLNQSGIESLLLWQDQLVIIQNGIQPQRIMRLSLDPEGRKLTAIAPLSLAQPWFNYPNFSTLRGNELWFLANSHWVRTPGAPEPVRVGRVNVENAPVLVAPDVQKFLREQEARKQVQPAADQAKDEGRKQHN